MSSLSSLIPKIGLGNLEKQVNHTNIKSSSKMKNKIQKEKEWNRDIGNHLLQ
jgi:hypothetical protein